ncbi:hypothetical protein BH10PSE19_BH10PSE19_02650 [soil metagenome]
MKVIYTNNYWGKILFFALIIFVTEKLSFLFVIPSSKILPLWPASGIAVAIMLCFGYRTWPGVFIGTFVFNLLAIPPLLSVNGILGSLSYAVGETIEPIVAVATFLYFTHSKIPYSNLYSVFIFLFFSAMLAGAVGATVENSLALLFNFITPTQYQHEWFSWWLSAVVSILLVTPAIMAWTQEKLYINKKCVLEFLLFLILLVYISWHIFFGSAHDSFLLVPFAVWASIRFKAPIATSINVLIALMVLIGTINGSTEFIVNSLDTTLLTIQAFIAVISITSLVLLAFIRERESASQKILRANVELEERVKQRTQALAEKNQQLNQTIDALKKAQSQLVQSEKMSTIGLLTAGIAHEINNSVNFISSNLTPLQDDVNDILAILEQYEKSGVQSADVQAIKAKIDLDYTVTETKNLFIGMEEGARRTTNIVKDLRTFSRLDEAGFKKINLAANIDSTLSLLQHHFKDKITIHRYYEELPEIECNPGKLNQAIMNILMNAVAAIKDKGEITLSLTKTDKQVHISIKDTGSGMDKQTQEKIFEPFFTTKDVGKGTGLGLSITYKVIQDHHGIIEVKSEIGHGTEFIITLPISQKM